MIPSALLRTCASIVNRQLTRHYAFKSDLKIKWVRPQKIPSIHPAKSGDCGKLAPISNKVLMCGFENSKELQTADDTIRSLFELGNNPKYHTSDYYRKEMIKEVQRHPLDYGSMEARLARMTATIRRYQEHMLEHPRDKKRKVSLKEMIEKRKRFLKLLRRWDYRRFEWILEKLDLVYKPHPPKYHWITRKESLQKLTDIHCEQLKQERLDNYRKILEEQQIPFLEDAIRKMEFIRQEQIDLDIPVTITVHDIEDYKKHVEQLKLVNEGKKAEAESSTL